jgi:flavin-dependent dehydrogenase
MHLEQAFLTHGHTPCHVTRSSWGGAEVIEQDALRNLDGHGWHLDRDRFDAWLAGVAAERGAALLTHTRLLGVQREAHPQARWQMDLERMGKPLRVQAELLIDASGRDGALAKYVGSKRQAAGKLVCGWLFGHDSGAAAGISELHAEAEGWWYSSSSPGRRRLLAFYTDADLPAARAAHSAHGLLARFAKVPQLQRRLTEQGFRTDGEHGFCAAHGATLDQPWGEGWLAVGDAALAFDPLSSQGLFNALYTGLAGAEAAHRHLQGEAGALADYGGELKRVRQAYSEHLDAWYRQENRWPESVFWQRRHKSAIRQQA